MKILITIFAAFLFSQTAVAGNGSFLILKSAYLYQNKTKQGQRNLTRKRKAYDVIDISHINGSSLMFQILIKEKKTEINGTGYIVETESELKELGVREVRVYPDLPEAESNLTDFQPVPSNQLSFTGKKATSPDFPKLSWKAVNYKASIFSKAWIPEWAGIYRPDKDALWLNRTYDIVISRNLEKRLVEKILTGQVEIGFTMDQVRMAFGKPTEEHAIENNTKMEWIYPSHKVIFSSGIVSRVL
jgi:hypothetical protein